MAKHYMVDLETLGTGNDAVIVALAAVLFDPNAGEHRIDDGYYMVISPGGQDQFKRTMDASTIYWWMGDDRAEARKAIIGVPSVDLPTALEGMALWMDTHDAHLITLEERMNAQKERCVWGNGATFDNVILSSAYRACGIERPWSYKGDMCFRTMRMIGSGIMPVSVGTAHQALDDATAQAYWMQDIVRVRDLTL